MSELIYFIVLLLVAGAVAGFLAGLFGIGGGLVFIPTLFLLFIYSGMSEAAAMALAVGTSLACILFNSSASVLSHYRLRNIDWYVVKRWSIPLVGGVLVSSNFIDARFGKLLLSVFIILLVFVAGNLFADVGKRFSFKTERARLWQYPIAFVIGVVSVMAGVGGGAMSVPALIISGLDAHRAVGTSACLGLLIAIPAVVFLLLTGVTAHNAPSATWGAINYAALCVLAPSSMILAPFGAKFGKRLPALVLKRAFACCLLVVAASMYIQAF